MWAVTGILIYSSIIVCPALNIQMETDAMWIVIVCRAEYFHLPQLLSAILRLARLERSRRIGVERVNERMI